MFLSTIGSSMKTFKQESATKYQNSAKYSDTTRYLQHYRILFRVILLQIDLGDMKSYHKIAKKNKTKQVSDQNSLRHLFSTRFTEIFNQHQSMKYPCFMKFLFTKISKNCDLNYRRLGFKNTE